VTVVPDLLPLFPLESVLVPGVPLPLRIFEPRYVQLLTDVVAKGVSRRFGVVALTVGREVQHPADASSAPQFATVGTVAEIVEVEAADDGTFSLLTTGSQRFRVQRLVETDKPYLVAEVEFLDEIVGAVPPGLVDTTRELVATYLELFGNLQNLTYSIPEYPSDVALSSYRFVAESPLSQDEQQMLLQEATAGDRLLRLRPMLRREIALLRGTGTVPAGRELLHREWRLN
jgi:Lon protease-like protein